MPKPHIILNRVRTPDGTIITSHHVHDIATHFDKNGHCYQVDGGLIALFRSNPPEHPPEELSLREDEPWHVVRANKHWGINFTKDKEPLPATKWTPIKDLGTDHIRTILNEGHGSDWMREKLQNELEYRRTMDLEC